MATTIPALPAIRASPSVLQYHVPKNPAWKRPLYKKRFYPNDDAQKTLSQPWLAETDPLMPIYPFGKNMTFEEANHGLYGGATIQSGNKVSDGRNKGRTVRKWYPNVRVEKLRSKALNVEMHIPTTASVMRTINKCGGLDEYVLGEKPARIKELGLLGWKLRWLVMKSAAIQARHARERATLGLPTTSSLDSTFAHAWQDPDIRSDLLQKMAAGWTELKEKEQRFQTHVKNTLKWEEDVLPMKSLTIHDPKVAVLPEEIHEDLPSVPQVESGFGIIEVMTGQGQKHNPPGTSKKFDRIFRPDLEYVQGVPWP